MNHAFPKLLSLSFAAALLSSCHGKTDDGHAHPSASAVALPPGANPVQQEMRVLHEASRDWVTAISNNDLGQIPASIEKIHVARNATAAALEKGAYKPPKNGELVKEFEKQDEEFHGQLVELIRASKANDLAGTTKQLGVVLEGCTSCHVKYRF